MKRIIEYLPVCLMVIVIAAICFGAANINTTATVSGLGSGSVQLSLSFAGTTPDAVFRAYRQLDTADTNETIAVGDISTVEGILLSCVDDSNDTTTGGLLVDCNSASGVAFSADLTIAEGQAAYFKPLGDVEVIGANSVEKPYYEYVVFGTR